LQVGHTAEYADGVYHHRGAIDDFRIYNRVLSQAEITALASALPIAAPDSYGTAKNQTLNVAAPGVLRNDTAFGVGIVASAALDTDVAHGALTLNGNGSFTYTPVNGFLGTDLFPYHVLDSKNNASVPATVTIPVFDYTVSSVTPANGASGQIIAKRRKRCGCSSASGKGKTWRGMQSWT
jgi:hypothetical protein